VHASAVLSDLSVHCHCIYLFLFLFTAHAATLISTLSLHDALPIFDALRPDPTQHAEPIQPRQPEIQDEEIEIPREFHGRVSVGHRVGLEPFRPEPLLNKIRDALLVLGDEYPVHSSSLTGNTSVNVAPRPGLESTVTSPPCAWAIRRTIARPSPLLRSRLFSGPERTNRSKMRCWSSRAIPLPSSRTHK